MRGQRMVVMITAINFVLLVGLLGRQVRPVVADDSKGAAAAEVVPVLRGRALEIVDAQDRVRAMIAVMPPSRVDGRIIRRRCCFD
jgi:hypothetical protein